MEKANRSGRQVSNDHYKRYTWKGHLHNSSGWLYFRSVFLSLKNDKCLNSSNSLWAFWGVEIAVAKNRYDWNLEGNICHY